MPVKNFSRPLLMCLAALVACSGGDVILDVDILSFLTDSGDDPEAVSVDLAVPLLPAPIMVTGVSLLTPSSVQLVEAIDNLTVIQEGELIYAMEARTREGSGEANIRLRLADSSAALADAASVFAAVQLDLVSGSTTASGGSLPLDAQTLALFSNSELWVSMDMDLQLDAATASDDSLNSRVVVTELRVRIVADEDFF